MPDYDDLEQSWKGLGLPEVPPEQMQDPPLLADRKPGELVIGSKTRPLVRIDAQGNLTYCEGYDPDVAAQSFWRSMAAARLRTMGEDVYNLFYHMQDLLVAYGDALLDEQDLSIPKGRVQQLAIGLAQAARTTAPLPQSDPDPDATPNT